MLLSNVIHFGNDGLYGLLGLVLKYCVSDRDFCQVLLLLCVLSYCLQFIQEKH